VLAGVSREQLSLPTPCQSWDVAALIDHVVGAQLFFAAGVTGAEPDRSADFAAGDFVQSFDDASATCVAAFDQDGVMERMLTLPFGEMPGSAFMGLAMTDIFQHAWDLAKATGQSTDLAPELASALLAQSKLSIQEQFRGPEGAPFGAEQHAGDDAPPADQLAAFLGRAA
jgi:uncharacterized protein (TIGR03086 family)